jgi:hypothetical protein
MEMIQTGEAIMEKRPEDEEHLPPDDEEEEEAPPPPLGPQPEEPRD